MNRSKLKTYAPRARRDFIQAVTDRAAVHGLTKDRVEPVTEQGDVAIIGGRPFPRAVAAKRRRLEERIQRDGFDQVMEAMAYTWFNRFVAIRFMELHGYFDHGYRVLSPAPASQGQAGGGAAHEDRTPEILRHAEHVDLPGLDKHKVLELKLDGSKEAELYRMLLIAQCNALHAAMPFLFEKIDDETELLLPDNLLHSDSLIRKLVGEIDQEDWQEVEIIGWLYQFYISEKKDEVIGKVVASEDIPAATQLFTPNWIVKYLVQNTLGRQWLATYPQSALRQQMQYYIEPAEQTPEVQEQLKAITPTSLNPEELTLLDPACGSGHILAEAYDLFKTIYQERGYRAKDIPALILQKNLFGLEIDDRAAQLAAFALMMKARADDRRIFESEAKPNVVAIQDSQGMNAADLTLTLNSPILKEKLPPSEYLIEEIEDAENPLFSKKVLAEKGHVSQGDIGSLLTLFENAKTFGSLIQVPPKLAAKLPQIEKRLDDVLNFGDLTHAPAHVIKPLLQQGRLLARRYDAVVANPPYMGSKFCSPTLKAFVNREYKEAKADLYSCFMKRNAGAAKVNGFVGMITIPNWMFLSSFEDMRVSLFQNQAIDTFIHNGRGVFGSDFGSCSFVLRNASLPRFFGSFRRLFDKQGSVASNEELEERFHTAKTYSPSNADFSKVPGSPVSAYSLSHKAVEAFTSGVPLSTVCDPRQGLATTDNKQFVRQWWEVAFEAIGFGIKGTQAAINSGKRWFSFNKGGPFRKWYGNIEHVVDWKDAGAAIKNSIVTKYPYLNGDPNYVAKNQSYYFRTAITWTDITSSVIGFRLMDSGIIPSHVSHCAFADEDSVPVLMAMLNSPVVRSYIAALSPSVHFDIGYFGKVPYLISSREVIRDGVLEAISIARKDWDDFETSSEFHILPALRRRKTTLQASQEIADAECVAHFARMKELEEKNNRLFIEAYGLQDELKPEVPDDQITLYCPDRAEDIKRLLSYAIGCMMGRYSLDKPGLIYAQSGNQGFDPSLYQTFRADDDGIIPLLETDWGIRDDATNRIVEFIGVAWPKDYLEENLKFIADSLGPTAGEQPRETIRRYLATGFYKHHLSMYKRRPIYWLFSSGKRRAFQCLAYLHRYHEGTLARMRTEYVIPLLGQIAGRITYLEDQATSAGGGASRVLRERDKVRRQLEELREFDEKLRHYADQRIKLDLDDGVKVNYAKFGDLLAEVKAVCGKADEE